MGFVLVLNLCLGADKLIVFFAKDTLGLRAWQVGVVVTVGGVGGVLGAAATGWWCRRLGPLPLVASCAITSGVALIMLSAAGSMPVLMAANLLYTWAIVAASVTMRALRQVLVPRELLGRVTAAWRLAAQVVTPIGAVAAGALAGALGGDPRPVFAVAGGLTIADRRGRLGRRGLAGGRRQRDSRIGARQVRPARRRRSPGDGGGRRSIGVWRST